MRLKDVPQSPAYFVCHDHYMKGAMDVWPMESLEAAQKRAQDAQDKLDAYGGDSCHYAAYEKLPRCKIWKYHA